MSRLRNGKKLRRFAGVVGRGAKAAGRGAKELGAGFSSGVAGDKPITKRRVGRTVGRGTRTVVTGLGRGVAGDAKRMTGRDRTFQTGPFGVAPAMNVFDVTGRTKPVKVRTRKKRLRKKVKKQKQRTIIIVR